MVSDGFKVRDDPLLPYLPLTDMILHAKIIFIMV